MRGDKKRKLEGVMGFWGGDVEGKRQEPRVGPSEVGKGTGKVGNGAKGRATVGAGRWVSLLWQGRSRARARTPATSFPRTGLTGMDVGGRR